LHNKPHGCSASVASAAGPFTTKKKKSFKYLGAMVNTDNNIEEEVKERIVAGNRAFYVHKKLFTSKLIS
jgi:hypothetical protein